MAAVGAGSVQGNAITCQVVAVPVGVQPKSTEVAVKAVVVNAIGVAHGGGGPHVMLATHPAAVMVALEVKTKVKAPSAALDVNTGGNVVPEYVPIKLAADTTEPLYTFNTSLFNSVLKDVKVTVTTSPGVPGIIVVVPVAAVVLLE